MKRLIWIIMLPFCLSTMTMAQIAYYRINAVKKDAAFLYGEATLQTKHEAVRLACDLLKNEVKKWSEENKKTYNDFPEAILTRFADTIVVERSNHTRAFVYVKISDVASAILNGNQIKSEKPIIVEEPTVSAPPLPVVQQAPPKEETPKLVSEDSSQRTTKATSSPTKTVYVQEKVLDPVLEKIKAIDSFYDLESVMVPLYKQGKIKSYGKYATMQNPLECYIIIYDSNGYIKALLGKGNEKRQNLKTLQADNEHNYPGCGAIWFKLAGNN